jgi:hypothetical protein
MKRAQRRQLMKRRLVPLPESQTLSSKLHGPAELQSGTAMKSVKVNAPALAD